MTDCKECMHEHWGRCRLNPKQLAERWEWVDSGHPQVPGRREKVVTWEFPPADARCGQFSMRLRVER